MTRGRSDTDEGVNITEAERHLNFNLRPDSETQRKIDYFLTPYNKSKVIQKYMEFEELNLNESSSAFSKASWNTISKLILGKNKNTFRRTLLSINNKLYDDIGSLFFKSKHIKNYEELNDIVKKSVQRSNSTNRRIEYKQKQQYFQRLNYDKYCARVQKDKARYREKYSQSITKYDCKTDNFKVFQIKSNKEAKRKKAYEHNCKYSEEGEFEEYLNEAICIFTKVHTRDQNQFNSSEQKFEEIQ